MKNPEHLTRQELIQLANGQKSMIGNLQGQLKIALQSNAELYIENKRLKEAARVTP